MNDKLLPYTKFLLFIIFVIWTIDAIVMPMLISITKQAASVDWLLLMKTGVIAMVILSIFAFLFTVTLRKCREITGN
jgi:hypothetical protein